MPDRTERPVEERVGDLLRDADETLAVAESCTGGLVGSKITDIPGSSDYFDRSLVTYSYEAKREVLAVSRESLDAHGAVSEPVAAEMARGVRDTAGTDWAVATTGIAGPDGGTPETPVGTVYIGVAEAAPWGTNESGVTVTHYEFDGSRCEVKDKIATQALQDVETALQE
ncbi:MAG: CinA family protein [Haloarcula sp.]